MKKFLKVGSTLIVSVLLVALFGVNQLSAQLKEPVKEGKERLSLFKQHLKMKTESSFKDLNWQFLGPNNTSGRIVDIAVTTPKGKEYTIYAASASGGVWKTKNEATTWEPVFDQEASSDIGDIAIAPSNQNIVWVGTGEANIFRSSMAGIGIYKSADAGKTWKHMGLENTNTIARIVVHPKNSDIVYVAATGNEWTNNPDRGVYKTTDGGKNWIKVLYVDEKTGSNDIVMDPNNPNVLYATTWQRIRKKWNDPRSDNTYTGSGVWKTTNGGKDWIQINKGLPEPPHRGRIGIDICLSNPKVLYVFVDNYEKTGEDFVDQGDNYGAPSSGRIKGATVYKSVNKGDSWTQMSGLTEKMKPYMEGLSNTYGWVFGQIRVDPNNEKTVYIMGLRLHVSYDSGKTFKSLRTHGGDHHGLWIDPENSNYLINVNDHGINASYDGGKNWKSMREGLPLVQFYNVGYDMDTPFHVYGSIQDHGSRKGTVDLSRGRDNIPAVDWEGAPGGEGSNHCIDPRDPNIVYSAGFYGSLSRTNIATGDRKSIQPKMYPDEPKLRGQWLAKFILSPHNPDIVYHGMQYLFRSKDKGNTWERISPDLTSNDKNRMGDIPFQTIFSISESPLKYGIIYVGTDDGHVHVTKDGGKNWSKIETGIPKDRWISRMVASKYDMATVYMTQNGKRDDDFAVYVWKSTDFGQTWMDISGNIPYGPVNVIREDPRNSDIVYVGTDVGAYVTKDGGKKWEVLGGNLPSTYVQDLMIHPRDNIIVIATHGRGMWAMDANSINSTGRNARFGRR